MTSRLSILSARQAIEDAKVELEKIDRDRVGVITGCGGSTFGDLLVYSNPNMKRLSFPVEMLNALSAWVSIDFKFKGPSLNIATACASGAFAIGWGYDYVRRYGDFCVAIGIDTVLHKDTIDGFNRILALSEQNEYPEKIVFINSG